MSIVELGALGEFIGAIAVVVTLVYLAMQLKQNTATTTSLIRQNFYESTQRQILHSVESTEFNQLLQRGWSTDEELSLSEQMQIWRHMQGVLMGYQSAYEQYKSGVLPQKDWQLVKGILRSFWLFEGRAKDQAWEQMKEGGFFNEDFLSEIQELANEAKKYKKNLDAKDIRL